MLEFPPALKSYKAKVVKRLAGAYRPSTARSHTMAIKTLAAFCIMFGKQFPKVATCTVISFIEFLADNALAPATIRNYIFAVKSVFK
jgi:hypothetical protein